VSGPVCGVVLRYNIIADGVGNIRMAARRRPLLEDLRIAGVVVGITQEDLRYFAGFALAVIVIAVRLDPDAGCVVGVFDNGIRAARIIGGDPPQPVLRVVFIGDGLKERRRSG
jgi:hypothetical protein